MPTFSASTGSVSATSTPTDRARLDTGRASTRRTIAPQNLLSELADSSVRRPTIGIRSRFTPSPSRPSTAGSSVSAATTETIPTRIAPTASERMIEFGTSSIPNIATTNTVPLNSTARLAVAPDASIAASSSRPCARSSR